MALGDKVIITGAVTGAVGLTKEQRIRHILENGAARGAASRRTE
jgi:hypothetical protein